ncbi:MAG TPA: hypothetical protein VLX61_10900 [Anaerolineales bacterium]|nr:hypothetical protein [Anaerolineales bacterium]
MPFPGPFLLIGVLNSLSSWFAVRVFGGKPVSLLVSLHVIYILSQGKIVGIMAGGFALVVAGLAFQRWQVAGAGALIALTKFQLGLVPFRALLLLWDAPWISEGALCPFGGLPPFPLALSGTAPPTGSNHPEQPSLP